MKTSHVVASVILRGVAAVGAAAVAFSYFWVRSIPGTLTPLWAWVAFSALLASTIAVGVKGRLIYASAAYSVSSRGGGLGVLLLGLAVFIAGSYGVVGGGISAWLQLVGSLASLVGIVWCAFGFLTARILLAPLSPLVFLVPISTSPGVLQETSLAGAATFLIGGVVISQFDTGWRTRALLVALAALAGAFVWYAAFSPFAIASTIFLILSSAAASGLGARSDLVCQVCGQSYGDPALICPSCARGVLTQSRSLAPLTLGVALLLVAGVVSVPLVSTSPYGVMAYNINGGGPVSLAPAVPGWTTSNFVVTSSQNSISFTSILSQPQSESTYAVAMSIHRPGTTVAVAPSSQTRAGGVLNGSRGIDYSVTGSAGHLSLVLSWETTVIGRAPNGTSSAVVNFQMTSPYSGPLNSTALASQLGAPGAVAEALYGQWSGYATYGLYVYEGETALGPLLGYIIAGIGAAALFGLAWAGLMADERTERRLSTIEELTPKETEYLSAKSGGISHFPPNAEEPPALGQSRSTMYEAISGLRSKGLVQVALGLRSGRLILGIKVRGLPRGGRP